MNRTQFYMTMLDNLLYPESKQDKKQKILVNVIRQKWERNPKGYKYIHTPLAINRIYRRLDWTLEK